MNKFFRKKNTAVVFLLLITTIYAFADYPTCRPGSGGDLASTSSPELTITVDVASPEQTITGFGASDAWSAQFVGDQWPLLARQQIARWLFGKALDGSNNPAGIGLSAWRFNLGAGSSRQTNIGDQWRRADTFLNDSFDGYDWNRLPGQRWFLQMAADKGVTKFTAFVNSPPINMTINGNAFCEDDSSYYTNIDPNKFDDFALYLTDILYYFENTVGITFDYISPFNEPQGWWDSSGRQEGCRYYKLSDMTDIITELYAEIGNQGVSAQISMPESSNIWSLFDGWNYIESFFNSSYTNTYVGNKVANVAGHSYGSVESEYIVNDRQDLRSKLNQYPGLDYSMTEYCILGASGNGRDLGIDPALHIARVIHFDLVVAEASSWDWWLAVSPYDYKDGLVYIDQNQSGGNYYDSKMLWAMGNYSRFIRPGMKRVNITRSDGASHSSTIYDLMVSSYYDSASGAVATVFVNSTSSDKLVQLNYNNLPVDKTVEIIVPYVTSSSDDLGAYNGVSVGETIVIPRESIVTLVGLTTAPSEYCGDNTCDAGEDACNCASDCGTPPLTETTCDDGLDEDCDGDVDCYDSDCDYDVNCYVPDCGDLVCEYESGEDACNCSDDCGMPAASETSCTDGISNDCDGDIDCADSDCVSDPACYVPACGTGICDVGEDECNCPSDCGTPPSTETICDDGDDEDCDGNTDCDDSDCDYDVNCYVTVCGTGICDAGEDACNCPSDCGDPATEICDNGISDDCDGDIDCADSDCVSDPACLYCGDGGDCDINDLVDMVSVWLTSDSQWDIAPGAGDGMVDYIDFTELVETWTP